MSGLQPSAGLTQGRVPQEFQTPQLLASLLPPDVCNQNVPCPAALRWAQPCFACVLPTLSPGAREPLQSELLSAENS